MNLALTQTVSGAAPQGVSRMCFEKTAFLTKDEAKRAKHDFRKASGIRFSVYQCANCHCWHFTSQKESD
jgi:hypothetical protein